MPRVAEHPQICNQLLRPLWHFPEKLGLQKSWAQFWNGPSPIPMISSPPTCRTRQVGVTKNRQVLPFKECTCNCCIREPRQPEIGGAEGGGCQSGWRKHSSWYPERGASKLRLLSWYPFQAGLKGCQGNFPHFGIQRLAPGGGGRCVGGLVLFGTTRTGFQLAANCG